MTQFLPPNLLALFAPRDPIPYLPPAAKLPHEKVTPGYSGVAQFMTDFEDPKETPPPTRSETKDEKKDRVKREKQEAHTYKLEQDLAIWDPHSNSRHTEDAFKTLFIARINFDTTESKLRREFEVYGPIRSIRMVSDADSGKPRGYAFIEYEEERDMHSAYKHADGKKIDGRRVLVDVERARTVKGWRPRRLGGGLGSTRRNKEEDREEMGGTTTDRREKERSRSREKERKRRSRSPKRRSKSRERRRSREKDRSDRGDRERERGERERSDRGDRGDRGERADRVDRDKGDREERRRSRSKEKTSKRSRRSRSKEKKRSRSRDRKRSRRSRSRERRKDKEVKVKTEKTDDGYPGSNNGEESRDGAPMLNEGESQSLSEYPMPPEYNDSNGTN